MESAVFELNFAKAYPYFTQNLVNKASDLTPNEVKICMLIKMSFSNVQILNHLKISKSTLLNSRSGIRHKLKLGRKESLTNFILSI